jgi:L-arabinokinase
MPQSLVFYVSGHGFGHASRDIEVINGLLARVPDLQVHVRTYAPQWLFDLTVRGGVHYHRVDCDTGVVQRDTLNPDIDATVARAREFYSSFDPRVTKEAVALREIRPSLVIGDLPPLAFAAAALADVPSVALGNFTWDWIYDGYEKWLQGAAWIPPLIRDAHGFAAEAWRLPMHGGFDGFRHVVDLPLVARISRREPAEVKRRLGIADGETTVLVSFGGFGLESVGTEELSRLDDHVFVVTEGSLVPKAPRTAGAAATRRGNLVAVNEHAWYGEGFRYEDLVKAADVVVTKPGFGIIAESVANDAAVVYTSRGPFAEYDVLVERMPKYLRCAFLSNEDLLGWRWRGAIEQALSAARPPERPPVDGADFAADRALSYLV